ncbi:MAG TPA: hypothetical protein VMU48_16560, partial [Terracidiphilus sp.]|nr:hypothetical protein [Terracidiphilus sp.]
MRKLMFAFLLATVFIPFSSAQSASTRRPMTFEDMMAMKRLGETAVSADGKWLAYGVTTVNLDQNSKTTEWWLQKIAGGEPFKVAEMQPGDSGLQFSADSKRILFLSRRSGSQQIWLADFDSATGTASNPFQLTHNTVEPDNAKWAPDGRFIVFTADVYPDCPAFTDADASQGSQPDRCNADRDKAAAESKVKAQIFTHLLYRHWDHYTGAKRSHLFLVTVENPSPKTLLWRDLTPGNSHDVPPFSLEGGGCGCDISPDSKELAYTDNIDPVQAISVSAKIFTLDLTNPDAKPVQISTSAGGNFNPAYSPDGKYLAWRSQARAGYESDRFRLVVYDRATKTIKDLLDDFKFDNWVDEFNWNGPEKVLFASGDHGEAPIYEVNVTGDDLHRFGKASGDWSDPHMVVMNGLPFIVGTLARVNRPAEVALGNALEMDDTAVKLRLPASSEPAQNITSSSYEPKVITHLNDALLAQLDLPKMEDFWFTAKDGTKIQGFLIRPPGFDAAKKYPVKFLIHGGPQGAWGDSWSYRWNAELFAANGYVVV